MHINHRRTNKHRTHRFPIAYSLRWYRQRSARDRRAFERELMAHGRYDDLPNKYHRDILYNYW